MILALTGHAGQETNSEYPSRRFAYYTNEDTYHLTDRLEVVGKDGIFRTITLEVKLGGNYTRSY